VKATKDSIQLIFGLGKTGLSCAEFLNDRALPFRAVDTRDAAPFAEQISQFEQCQNMFCGNPEQNLDVMDSYLEHVEQIIVSPGIARTGLFFDKVREKAIDLIGDIELFAREAKAPVIAITGSNGKSTVTELTGELLAAAGKNVLVGGNIGIPALDLLKLETPDLYVLELSSFQLETTFSLRPVAATVLNLSEDHLDRYDSFSDYADVKMSLLKQSQQQVVNRDEFPLSASLTVEPSTTEITISLEIAGIKGRQATNYYRQQHNDKSIWVSKDNVTLFDQSKLKIAGLHNVSNAMAALALCEASGVEMNPTMQAKLEQWPGLQHRCEYVGEHKGIRCYNDSKATNVGATIAALEGLSQTIAGKLILIAGGDGKGADFKPLAEIFKRYLSALILIGKDAERLLEEAGKGIKAVIVTDMKQAVAAAFSFAEKGDAILLSPACASLDMYTNFEQRGDFFRQEVEARL